MRLYKPNFWKFRKNIFSIIFLPFSFIFWVLIYLRRKIVKKIKFNIPIICVGNIYVGGTGKTPLSILLANELNKKGKKTAIVRKYYSSHEDEHFLIKKYFKDLILDKKRESGIKIAEKNDFDIVILDDGFQDHKIKKNLKVAIQYQEHLVDERIKLIPIIEDFGKQLKYVTTELHINKSLNKIFNLNIGDNAEIFLNDVNYVKKNHFKT